MRISKRFRAIRVIQCIRVCQSYRPPARFCSSSQPFFPTVHNPKFQPFFPHQIQTPPKTSSSIRNTLVEHLPTPPNRPGLGLSQARLRSHLPLPHQPAASPADAQKEKKWCGAKRKPAKVISSPDFPSSPSEQVHSGQCNDCFRFLFSQVL